MNRRLYFLNNRLFWVRLQLLYHPFLDGTFHTLYLQQKQLCSKLLSLSERYDRTVPYKDASLAL